MSDKKSGIGIPTLDRPWMKYYRGDASQAFQNKHTIYENILEKNKGKEADNAFIYLGGKFSYGRLLSEIEIAATAFSAIGVQKGDIVAYCSLTCPEVAVSLYALNKIGAAIMLIDPRRGVEEIKKYLSDGKVKTLLLMDVFYPHIKEILPELNLKNVIVSPMSRCASFAVRQVLSFKLRKIRIPYGQNILRFDDFMKAGRGVACQTVPYDAFELAAITFSGGTTGTPKGIMLSNLTINSVTECYEHIVDNDPHPLSLSIVPVFASYGLACGLHAPLCLHYELIMLPKPDADKMGKLMIKYKPTHTFMVPGFYEKLIDSREMQKADMSDFLVPACGGDTISHGLEERVNRFFRDHGCRYKITQGYGMSEMCSVETTNYKDIYKPGSVGIPMYYVTVSVFEPGTSRELGYHQEGEICATGPTVMLGYLNNPEETEKIMVQHSDGKKWIHSGDLGYMDEDGFVFITGRIKRTIPRPDGHKVFPVQLENTVSKVENVAYCACVGVKDGKSTEGLWPVVAVVLADASKEQETMQKISLALQREIEFRSQPLEVYTVDALPLVGMGKIDYKKLADDYMSSRGIQ